MKALLSLIFGCLLLSGCATTANVPVTSTTGAAEQIPTQTLKPDGAGPFPAVVIMYDCSGLGPRSSGSPMRWARELVDRGYVVALPDSFSTRGHPGGVCTNPSPSRNDVAPARRVADAYAILAFVRTLPYVDGARVGIMGGSHGGTTTLFSMVAAERESEPLAREKRDGFTAAIAFYPGCTGQIGQWRAVRQPKAATINYFGVYKSIAPLLILTGELDDWTPAEPCRRLSESARQAGNSVSIKIYPGAHHAFDSNTPVRFNPERVNANAPTGRGATTGGDRDAWDDSAREVMAFFGQHLKKSPK